MLVGWRYSARIRRFDCIILQSCEIGDFLVEDKAKTLSDMSGKSYNSLPGTKLRFLLVAAKKNF